MKKPEKKEIPNDIGNPRYGWAEDVGYNQACDDWEEWLRGINLPSEEEILEIINKDCGDFYCNFEAEDVARAISKRIRGEQ